jgi:COP9 signalosome complex subunit 6
MGALIGKQKGRNVEISNSFELKFEVVDGEVIFNRDYYNTKEIQYKQVFSDLDFLGWYTTGDLPTENEVKIHKQICQINESSILLLLEPIATNVDRLPITLYESISTVDTVQCETNMMFVALQYTLATEEAERLGVDHVARMSNSDIGENSAVADHLLAQHSAIKMLHSRVKLVLSYIQDVHKGTLPFNQDILREIYALSQRLPIVQNFEFREKFYTQCNEVGLIIYLGALTKGCNDVNQLVNKFNILYDRQGMGRRMRGLFF